MAAKIIFLVALLLSASGLISPPVALALGLAFGMLFVHPFQAQARRYTKVLLQASVVALGFGMNLYDVWRAGKSGFVYTAVGIAAALILGTALGRLLGVPSRTSFLISAGTAICGGSAIAAVAPILDAEEEEIAVSLGTVFVLNSVALFVFPVVGGWLRLQQNEFGLWSALAIHDTSSVVGAAAKFGAVALAVATTVKLARALWIVPLSVGTALVKRHKARIQWPWFIAFFVLAAMLNTYLPHGTPVFHAMFTAGRLGLTVTLFLIGAGISKATLKRVGPRPLLQGVALWLIVASVTLWLVLKGVIYI
ncbi:MAG TPA: putative sulfate exporter family transporter [Terriglobales bacterium]|nr:putative sulfate exporter family transporter [Terriglobales bacterium]